jgi:hypothetical protein
VLVCGFFSFADKRGRERNLFIEPLIQALKRDKVVVATFDATMESVLSGHYKDIEGKEHPNNGKCEEWKISKKSRLNDFSAEISCSGGGGGAYGIQISMKVFGSGEWWPRESRRVRILLSKIEFDYGM